jgi:TP901 family phage tail tape measure protein
MSTVTDELLLRIAVEGGAVAAAEVDAFNARIAETEAVAGRATGRMGGLSNALMSMKALFAGLAIYRAIQDFSQFQSQMERLKTQTGATQAEVSKASKGILNMAASVATGPQSLAQAMYHIESAGYRGKTALDALHIAAEGATIGGADLTDTTTGLTAVMVAGFKGVHTLQAAMGELNATVGAGDMTMQDLNEALGTGLLATLKTLGLQVTDAGAALATLGDNNIRGAQAATRLRMGLMMLVHPSAAATKEIQSLGMSQLQLAGDMRKPNGLLVMLEDLQKHLKGLSPTDRASALAEIFGGGRNSAAMLTLLNQMDRLKSKYDMVDQGGKNFNADWQATTKTLSFFIDQVKALVQVGLIKLGGALNTVAGYIEDFVKAVEHGRTWALYLAGALGGIVGGFLAIRVAMLLWAGTVAIIENLPLIALLAAIGVGIMLLIKHWKTVKEAALDAAHWISAKWHDLTTFIESLPGRFAAAGRYMWNGLKQGAIDVVNWIIDRINNVIGAINSVTSSIPVIGGNVLNPIGHVGGSVPTGVGTSNQSGFMSTPLHLAGHKAMGGSVDTSGAYLVGEKGPEIVYLNRGAYVQPNHGSSNGGHPQTLQATLVNVMDGRVVSRSVIRQGLMATARRGAGGAVLDDAG